MFQAYVLHVYRQSDSKPPSRMLQRGMGFQPMIGAVRKAHITGKMPVPPP